MTKKLSVNGIPGIFNAPVALAVYAKIFEEEGALDELEAFASLNGPMHYGLPPNAEMITLVKRAWTVPEEIKVPGPDERELIHYGGETMAWQVGRLIIVRTRLATARTAHEPHKFHAGFEFLRFIIN